MILFCFLRTLTNARNGRNAQPPKQCLLITPCLEPLFARAIVVSTGSVLGQLKVCLLQRLCQRLLTTRNLTSDSLQNAASKRSFFFFTPLLALTSQGRYA